MTAGFYRIAPAILFMAVASTPARSADLIFNCGGAIWKFNLETSQAYYRTSTAKWEGAGRAKIEQDSISWSWRVFPETPRTNYVIDRLTGTLNWIDASNGGSGSSTCEKISGGPKF